jgi:hypothetical protein
VDLVYRGLGAVGTTGGTLALLVFLGLVGDEPGNPSLLAIAVVFLGIGIPSLVKWIRTL